MVVARHPRGKGLGAPSEILGYYTGICVASFEVIVWVFQPVRDDGVIALKPTAEICTFPTKISTKFLRVWVQNFISNVRNNFCVLELTGTNLAGPVFLLKHTFAEQECLFNCCFFSIRSSFFTCTDVTIAVMLDFQYLQYSLLHLLHQIISECACDTLNINECSSQICMSLCVRTGKRGVAGLARPTEDHLESKLANLQDRHWYLLD